jgi:hypothetical protein
VADHHGEELLVERGALGLLRVAVTAAPASRPRRSTVEGSTELRIIAGIEPFEFDNGVCADTSGGV